MLASSLINQQNDLGIYLGTRAILTELWKKEAPLNAMTWYPAQKRVLTFDNARFPLTSTDAEQALLKVPKDILPCLLTYAGGLVLRSNAKNNYIVHEADTFSPWEAVVKANEETFEVTPVSISPLGRRAALRVAGSIIEAVCPLCPFNEVCNHTPKPFAGSLYQSTLNYSPGIMVDI